jgi:CubicO group peptidase (beta-lactamase class C family)
MRRGGVGTRRRCPPARCYEDGFQIASITKTAVMRLVERHDVELDAPVRRYLPGLRLGDEASTERLTVTHLLTHTAGSRATTCGRAYTVHGARRKTAYLLIGGGLWRRGQSLSEAT